MKDLVFISCQPDDKVFEWQIDVQLHNFRKYGYADRARVLVFLPSDRLHKGFNPGWKQLEKKYPEVKFFYYEDTEDILNTSIRRIGYIPLLRPWMLKKHFAEYPELEDKAIFYHDSDVIFTRRLDFTPFLYDGDEDCYLSDTRSYIAASYFDSKAKDVLESKKEDYAKIDVLDSSMKLFGLTRQDAVDNENGSGGAQYLLKNINSKFWEDVYEGCINIRTHLRNINTRYFESEDKGFQSWCADMWSVLWNLWKRGVKTYCPKELDFAWATDKISKWREVYIYHDAGAGSNPIYTTEPDGTKKEHRLFFKREMKYVNNISSPLQEDLSYVSKDFCSSGYVREIEDCSRFS